MWCLPDRFINIIIRLRNRSKTIRSDEAALLKPDAEGQFISVQPFDPKYLPETKYGGEVIDPNAHLIPYVISEATLKGEHISEFKQRQIDQQHIEQTEYDDNQLKPAEDLNG